MKVLYSLVCAAVAIICLVKEADSVGAGRAFPIQSENYAIYLFKSVNEDIEWDPTNFLVDLSGLYANCRYVGVSGLMGVDRNTPYGNSMVAIVDDTAGEEMYSDAINEYITEVLDSWMHNNVYRTKIIEAETVGCSVRPGCDSRTVVSCFFSPGRLLDIVSSTIPSDDLIEPQAYAFTLDQYMVAEEITGNRWDRSFFLENLSGQETSCSMISSKDWSFAHAKAEGRKRGKYVDGLFGNHENRGSTQQAMEIILSHFKKIEDASNVGCSVIPDCFYGSGDTRQMYVVVSCLYEA